MARGDISAALRVVERSEGSWDIKKRYRPHPDDLPGTGGRATYQAIIVITEFEGLTETVERKFRSPWCWQLPEAICKAALLTKLLDNN